MCTTACHLSWARSVQSAPAFPIIFASHLRPGFPRELRDSGFPTKLSRVFVMPSICVYLSCYPFVCIWHVINPCVFFMCICHAITLCVCVMSPICICHVINLFVFVLSSICICHVINFTSHVTNLYLSGHQFLFFMSPVYMFVTSPIWICLVINLYLSCHQFLYHATHLQYFSIWST